MWEVELSEEVADWHLGLPTRDRAFADRALDRLAALGPQLAMPHSGVLGAGLREPRFSCEGTARRITYYFDIERKVITLTTFRKQRNSERSEIDRAQKAKRGDQKAKGTR